MYHFIILYGIIIIEDFISKTSIFVKTIRQYLTNYYEKHYYAFHFNEIFFEKLKNIESLIESLNLFNLVL